MVKQMYLKGHWGKNMRNLRSRLMKLSCFQVFPSGELTKINYVQMKEFSSSISDVSNTMLITLYTRAKESISRDPIIEDPKAVEMFEIIKKEIVGSENNIMLFQYKT